MATPLLTENHHCLIEKHYCILVAIIYIYIYIHIHIYINLVQLQRPHCDLSGIMVYKGNHPQMALIQVQGCLLGFGREWICERERGRRP